MKVVPEEIGRFHGFYFAFGFTMGRTDKLNNQIDRGPRRFIPKTTSWSVFV